MEKSGGHHPSQVTKLGITTSGITWHHMPSAVMPCGVYDITNKSFSPKPFYPSNQASKLNLCFTGNIRDKQTNEKTPRGNHETNPESDS